MIAQSLLFDQPAQNPIEIAIGRLILARDYAHQGHLVRCLKAIFGNIRTPQTRSPVQRFYGPQIAASALAPEFG
jgi:hypothetical protein